MDDKLEVLARRYTRDLEKYNNARQTFEKTSRRLLIQDRISGPDVEYALSAEHVSNTEALAAAANDLRDSLNAMRDHYRGK